MDMLRMSGGADLVESVDKGILTVRLERKVEVDRDVGGCVTLAHPAEWDFILGPRVHHACVFPTM